MADSSLTYVEGYACTEHLTLAIQHAWLVDAEGIVRDPTWTHGLNYLGMGVTTAAVKRLARETGRWGVFGMGTPAWVVESPEQWRAPRLQAAKDALLS